MKGVNKAWYAILLATIFGSPTGIIATVILFIVALVAGASFLVYYGLVSAMIYGLGAFLLVAFVGLLMGKDHLSQHWHSFIVFVALVPTAMLFGWFTDRMSIFGLSLIPVVNQQYVLSQNALDSSEALMVSGSYLIALVALALAVFAASMVCFRSGKKRRR